MSIRLYSNVHNRGAPKNTVSTQAALRKSGFWCNYFFSSILWFMVYSTLEKAWLFWIQGNREKCFWILGFDLGQNLTQKFGIWVYHPFQLFSPYFPILEAQLTIPVHIFLTKPVLRGKINWIKTCINLNTMFVNVFSSFHFLCYVHRGTRLGGTHTKFTGAAFTRGNLQTRIRHRHSW